jgi:ABC-type multidrug transport system permease subunit
MFTLLVLFTGGTVMLVVERRNGLLRRLASSPMSRGAVVAGKWGSRMLVGMVQLGVAMLTGRLLFGVTWAPLPAVLVLLTAYASLAAALAILIGSLCRTEAQAIGFGVIATNVLAALGGCWWPIEVTPEWAQHLALFLPTGWAMDGLHKLMSFGKPAEAVAPHVAALACAALLVGWAAARRFRFQ